MAGVETTNEGEKEEVGEWMATREERRAAYAEKLKDPRWQKRRLQILERDHWNCTACNDESSTLHVHHLFYENDKEPWEVEENALTTLCEECHEFESKERGAVENTLISGFRRSGFLCGDLIDIAGAVAFMPHTHIRDVVSSAIAWAIRTPDVQRDLIERYFLYLSERRARNKTK